MADWPSTTKWLTPEERLLAAQRLAYDGLGNTQGATGKVGEMTALRMVVTDWRTWILALLYALVTGAQTIQYFIPTLVTSFGWTSWDGQYHTIPPYACAFVFTLLFSFTADHFANKSFFITLFAGIGTIFFIIVCASTSHIVRCKSGGRSLLCGKCTDYKSQTSSPSSHSVAYMAYLLLC